MMNKTAPLYLLLVFIGMVPVYSQHAQRQSIDSLLLDPSIRYGQLANGLTYYIKDVSDGLKKINMRLHVEVGSAHQRPDQLDFAHAIEHLAFKCAKDFPINILDNPILTNRLGMTKRDIFALTRFFDTTYMFDIPSERVDALDMGLLWFANIADLKLTHEAIQSEKGPMRQESIFRNGDNLDAFHTKTRLHASLIPGREDFSNFFQHNINYNPDSLISFYENWYRPDRMSVVLVGDIEDIENIEMRVRNRLSKIEKKPSIAWIDCRMDFLKSNNRFVSLEWDTEKDSQQETVELYLYMRDSAVLMQRYNGQGLKRNLVWDILTNELNHRIKQAAEGYNMPFTAYCNAPKQYLPAFEICIKTTHAFERQAISKVIQAIQQVKRYGLSQEEWQRVKQVQLNTMRQADTTAATYWLEQIEEYVVFEKALPKHKSFTLQTWLSTLKAEEFNAYCQAYIKDFPNDIGIIEPRQAGMQSHTDKQIRGWIQDAVVNVQPYAVAKVTGALLNHDDRLTLKGVGYKDNGEITRGVREFVLNNGVRVVIDTLVSVQDKVYLLGFSPKGAAHFPEADFFSAINSPVIVKNAGVGDLDKSALNSYLKNTSFKRGLYPFVDNWETKISGDASGEEDLEKMLQLLYLYFTAPRKDLAAFENWKAEEKSRHSYNASYDVIKEDFNVAINDVLGDRSKNPEGTKRMYGIAKTDMDKAYRIYRKLYSNASDFTFVLSGSISVNTALPLIQKYIGNLPVGNKKTMPNSVAKKNQIMPETPKYTEFFARNIGAPYEMNSVKYSVRFVAPVVDPSDWKENVKMDLLGKMMYFEIQALRFSMDAAMYDYQAFSKLNRELGCYDLLIQLDIPDESELDRMRKACKEIVEEVKLNSVSQERFKEVMNVSGYPAYSAKRQGTSYFVRSTKIQNYYRYNEPFVKPAIIEAYVKSLTREDIRETARKYLKEEYMLEFVMRDSKLN